MTAKMKEMTMSGRIEGGKYCKVVDDALSDWGVDKGSVVFTAGYVTLPLSEEDLYTMRQYFLCLPVVNGVAKIPKSEADQGPLTVDPIHLELLPDEEQEGYELDKGEASNDSAD